MDKVKVKFRWRHIGGFDDVYYLKCGEMTIGKIRKVEYRGGKFIYELLGGIVIDLEDSFDGAKKKLIEKAISWFAKCGITVEEEK